MKDRKTRICMACCPGGHFAELRLATKEISESEYDIYWLTFKSTHLKGFLQQRHHHYVINVIPSQKWTWRTSRCYYFHWLWNGFPYNLFWKIIIKK